MRQSLVMPLAMIFLVVGHAELLPDPAEAPGVPSYATEKQVERSEAGCDVNDATGVVSTSPNAGTRASRAQTVPRVGGSSVAAITRIGWRSLLAPGRTTTSSVSSQSTERSEAQCDAECATGTVLPSTLRDLPMTPTQRPSNSSASPAVEAESYLTRRQAERAGLPWPGRTQERTSALSAGHRGPSHAPRSGLGSSAARGVEPSCESPPSRTTSSPPTSRTSPSNSVEALWARYVGGHARSSAEAAAIIAAVSAECAEHGVEPAVVVGLIQVESGFNPSARGASGEVGLCQLLPSTFVGWGEYRSIAGNIACGVAYLAGCIAAEGGSVERGLARYNGGPGGAGWGRCQAYAAEVLCVRNSIADLGPTR